ncbi:MAG: carbamoyl phosphate synthase small subunit [Coxiella sp. RIFCSPHIGHO2_12_FULL_42_15]|nr:MAG: carbamoyl phosphate synthase small subunit [Coxiella sp. RIFCSPHIGHO2_12_FULL_42_15]
MSLDTFVNRYPPALLALAEGSVFKGYSIGVPGITTGEVVFNTAMTGYQEILTDPSYSRQIVTLTYPHIGNVGVNPHDAESSKVHVAGLVIRNLSPTVSNWRSAKSLEVYLKQNGIVAISGIDTRRLTRILRDKGAQKGCILSGLDAEEALRQAQQFPGLVGKDLAKVVSTDQVIEWKEGIFCLSHGKFNTLANENFHVVAYDFGVKHQMLRLLVERGCRITLVPAKTSAEKVLAYQPDGILLSNGPGDPAACDDAIANIKILLQTDIPILGICLGFQLLGLACGAKTVKMKFGHHGANHPVQDLQTKTVAITSQNHGFSVDEASLPATLQVTHRSLFDGTLQGFKHRTKPILAFQGHPEASPGPQDLFYLFDEFITLMTKHQP